MVLDALDGEEKNTNGCHDYFCIQGWWQEPELNLKDIETDQYAQKGWDYKFLHRLPIDDAINKLIDAKIVHFDAPPKPFCRHSLQQSRTERKGFVLHSEDI